MGTTLSVQRGSRCEEDEEQHLGQDELSETSAEAKLLQKNVQNSSLNGKSESQTEELSSQSEEGDLVDVGSRFVTLKEDASDTTDSIHEVSQTSTDDISKQMSNTDDIIEKEENEANNKRNDTETGFKTIFKFGGFKFLVKKNKFEKIDAEEPIENEQDITAVSPSEDAWGTINFNSTSTNKRDAEEIRNERMGGDTSTESPRTQNEMTEGNISSLTENREDATSDKGLLEDVPQRPELEETMSPIKRFFSQGILVSLRKKRKEEETPKENKEELKGLYTVVEKETTKEDTTCTCLNVSNGTFDKNKDVQLFTKDEPRPAVEGDIMNSLEEDKVQASPFKRLFRKLSTRRHSETKSGDTNSLEPGDNISENPQLCTELIMSQKEQETKVLETQPADEMMDISNEESKKKSDSSVSWENLICVRSAKTRARKTSDSEDETQDKAEVPRRKSESPLESSTEGQGGSPAEEDSGSTWKSFKKLVTPKRKSRMEESGSVEQMQSDTEISKDESSCSLRKLISGRKKTKLDGQQENISSDEGSKGTGTDIEDDETPGLVPLSEYEITEHEILNVMTDGTIESKKEKEMQSVMEEDKPKQLQPLYNLKPLCFNAGPSDAPIPTEYMEELTEFLSKHQQLSDIPEEGIIEESVATPSFVEWTTQDETLADDTVDITADAVTAPEHASEHSEDETTEMVSAVSQLSDSPRTGNLTPVSPVHSTRESDTIFQEVFESISMVPGDQSIIAKEPEALTASVSKFIVESTTTNETKVLITHKKEETTSICIGIVSQEIRAAEVVLPLPLFEGISEITHAVPTEFVSEDLAEESEAAGIVTDNVYEAEIKEIKAMIHEVLLLNEQRTILSETARKSKQQIIMVENIQVEDSPEVQMEVVEDDSTELFNVICGIIPVHAAVHSITHLFEGHNTTLNMNKPETEGPLQSTLEEPVYEQLTQNTKIPVEVEKEHRNPGVKSSAADVEQLTLVAAAGPVACSVVESIPDSSLNRVSKMIDDDVHVTDVATSVTHSVIASEPDPAMKYYFPQASEIIEDMTGVLVSDVTCSETTGPITKVIPISDSIKIERDLENEVQMKNDPSLHFAESHKIQVKVNNTELQTSETNADTVLPLGTKLDAANVSENKEMIGEEEIAKQKIEPRCADTIKDIFDEKIVCNFEAENLSEIIHKPTKERDGKETELNTFIRENTITIITTNEETAIKEPEDMSNVTVVLEKQHKETQKILVEDCKRKQTVGDEEYMLRLNTTETGEEAKKPHGISEQPKVNKEVEYGIKPPISDSLNPVSQPTFSKLIADTQTTVLAPGSREEDSAKTEAVERPCLDDQSDKLSADEQEHTETPRSEGNFEISTEQETIETAKPFPEVETRLDLDEPKTEILPSKPEKSPATESCHEPSEENNQATEAMDKKTETISAVTFTYEVREETQMVSDQPVADRVSSLEEVKTPCVDDQSVMSDTILAEKHKDNERAKLKVNAEHQEALVSVKTILNVEPQFNTKLLPNEMLSLKPEENQATESCHEPYEENNQITGTAEITETISSVTYQEETRVECEIFDQLVETGECFKGVDGVSVSTTEHVTEMLTKDKAESKEGFVIPETEGSEHVMEVIKASTYQVSTEVVSEHEAVLIVDSEQNIASPDVTEQEVEFEIDIANAEKYIEETTMSISERQTEFTSELVAESPVVIENKPEPEMLSKVINELEAETLEVADLIVASEVQAETSVVTSLVTMLEVETPVFTSSEKSINIEALALPSVINKVQSDFKSVIDPEVCTSTTLQETSIVVSRIQTPTGLSLVQTAALTPTLKELSEKDDVNVNRPVIVEVTEPKLEKLMVTDAISSTSAVPALEVKPVETSALEIEILLRTCVEKNIEAQSSVMTSIKKDEDVGSLVLTTTDSEAQLKTVINVAQTQVALKATDVAVLQKPADGQLIQEPEMSMVAQEIREENLETADAVDVNALKIPMAKETREEAPHKTEQIVKKASVVPEFEVISVKEAMGPSLFTFIAEDPIVASCIKPLAPVVQTPTIVLPEAQRPTVVPVVQTLAIKTAVKEVELPFTGPEGTERHCNEQVVVNIKQTPLNEIKVKVTEITERVTQDVSHSVNPKEDSESPEDRCVHLNELSVPVMKTVKGADDDDDEWEDAVDDISDEQCSSTKESGSLQDTSVGHGDK